MSETQSTTTPPSNGALLHKRHATVHTATIDVKVMRVDKKQVTMGLFRQLDAESIFNVDGTLAGTPWGRVNYRWAANPEGTAFHVVWQDGEQLKRSAVPRRGKCWTNWIAEEYPEDEPYEPSKPQPKQWSLGSHLEKLRSITHCLKYDLADFRVENHASLGECYQAAGYVPCDQFQGYLLPPPLVPLHDLIQETGAWHITETPDGNMSINADYGRLSQEQGMDARSRIVQALKIARKAWPLVLEGVRKSDPDLAIYYDLLAEYRRDYPAWKKRYQAAEALFWQRVAEMAQLDQLFIAV
jgi:hypothetical protein